MNIQIANRLLAYRKAKGLSQEELAEQIGVSRQAVSKWERGESSPDTDNLIALAELYGVTIDEMIKGTEPPCGHQEKDESSEENEDGQEPDGEFDFSDEESETRVHVGCDGVRIEDGDDKVRINRNGIYVKDKKGGKVYVGWNGIHVSGYAPDDADDDADDDDDDEDDDFDWEERRRGLPRWLNVSFPIIISVAYLLLGFLVPDFGWRCCWTLFLLIPVESTLSEAIAKRRANKFAYAVLCAFVYLSIGMVYGIWTPTWVLFLSVPVYHTICHEIERRPKRKK